MKQQRQQVELASTEAAVGKRIKVWRRQRDLTLDALAEMTGISKSYLSRLEAGKKAPSIATVMKLSRALGVSVGALFGEQTEAEDIHIVRRADRGTLAHGTEIGATFIPLSRGAADGLESFLYYPPDRFVEANRGEHAGEEMIYVLDGEVEVRFADRSTNLSEGDFLQFRGHNSHQIRGLTKGASVLIVIGHTE